MTHECHILLKGFTLYSYLRDKSPSVKIGVKGTHLRRDFNRTFTQEPSPTLHPRKGQRKEGYWRRDEMFSFRIKKEYDLESFHVMGQYVFGGPVVSFRVN